MSEIAYAGVGSRKTPGPVLTRIERIAYRLGKRRATLRSGGAKGSDDAFERGARAAGGRCEIFLPHAGFENRRDGIVLGEAMMARAQAIAATVHPAWNRCSGFARKAHGRNACQILGAGLNDPVRFVLCWAPLDGAGSVTGGTRTAVELARRRGIPVFNLAENGALERFYEFARTLFAGAE
jgi:hypothetical protein